MKEVSLFEKLSSLNCNEYLEKKGRFSYMSWAYAVDILKKNAPNATWRVIRFDGLPYLACEAGYFVEVEVTIDGIATSQIHPVLDNNNKPITKPNSFQINTSLQRALVKAIAVATGLGLYVYQGEDIPAGAEDTPQARETMTAELTIEQQEEQRGLFLEKILEKATELGKKGDDMLADFEEKAGVKLQDMNYKVLKRVYTLMSGEKKGKASK